MARATRQGDRSSGHDKCSPTSLQTGSTSVFINGKPAGRDGDRYAAHSCEDHRGHSDYIQEGSTSVFINGLPAARVGDSVSRGARVAEGSGNVFIG